MQWLAVAKSVSCQATLKNIDPWLGSNGSSKHWEEKSEFLSLQASWIRNSFSETRGNRMELDNRHGW